MSQAQATEKQASRFAAIAEAYGWPADTSPLDVLHTLQLDVSMDPVIRLKAASTLAQYTMRASKPSRQVGTCNVFDGVKVAAEVFSPPSKEAQEKMLKDSADMARHRQRERAMSQMPVFQGNVIPIGNTVTDEELASTGGSGE